MGNDDLQAASRGGARHHLSRSIYRSRLERALYARERWSPLVNDLYWTGHGALKRRVHALTRWHAQLKGEQPAADVEASLEKAGVSQ